MDTLAARASSGAASSCRRPIGAGYGWVTVGPNAYLMQRSTGLILDTAPLY
jgi:hypothetical protein